VWDERGGEGVWDEKGGGVWDERKGMCVGSDIKAILKPCGRLSHMYSEFCALILRYAHQPHQELSGFAQEPTASCTTVIQLKDKFKSMNVLVSAESPTILDSVVASSSPPSSLPSTPTPLLPPTSPLPPLPPPTLPFTPSFLLLLYSSFTPPLLLPFYSSFTPSFLLLLYSFPSIPPPDTIDEVVSQSRKV